MFDDVCDSPICPMFRCSNGNPSPNGKDMKFVTVSGSMYEVDLQEKKCRRLIGMSDPTPRQGKDGEWKVFQAIHPEVPVQGQSVLFVWDTANHPPVDADPSMPYVPATETSLVKEIVSSS